MLVCDICENIIVMLGHYCKNCDASICENCRVIICTNCEKKDMPKRYWVVCYANTPKGGFNDVILMTNDYQVARFTIEQFANNASSKDVIYSTIYDIYEMGHVY